MSIHNINNYKNKIQELLSDKYNKPELKTINNQIELLQEKLDDFS